MNSRRQTVFQAARQTTAAVRFPHETCDRRKFCSDGTHVNKASKTHQLLTIDPPCELKFRGSFTEPVHTVMMLKNSSYKKVAFKIRSSAPGLYFVSKICGELAPLERTRILVMFQPFGCNANKRNEHNIFVETVVIDPFVDYGRDGKTFQWGHIKKIRIVEYKLNCVFEMPSAKRLLESKKKNGDTTIVFGSELHKATTEAKKLRKEKNTLRQEVIALKEKLCHLQNELKNQPSQKRGSQQIDNQNRNAQIIEEVCLAIFVALFGVIAGKYVFW